MFNTHFIIIGIMDMSDIAMARRLHHTHGTVVHIAIEKVEQTLEEVLKEYARLHHTPLVITVLPAIPSVAAPLHIPKDIPDPPIASPLCHKCLRKIPSVQTRPPPSRGIFYKK